MTAARRGRRTRTTSRRATTAGTRATMSWTRTRWSCRRTRCASAAVPRFPRPPHAPRPALAAPLRAAFVQERAVDAAACVLRLSRHHGVDGRRRAVLRDVERVHRARVRAHHPALCARLVRQGPRRPVAAAVRAGGGRRPRPPRLPAGARAAGAAALLPQPRREAQPRGRGAQRRGAQDRRVVVRARLPDAAGGGGLHGYGRVRRGGDRRGAGRRRRARASARALTAALCRGRRSGC